MPMVPPAKFACQTITRQTMDMDCVSLMRNAHALQKIYYAMLNSPHKKGVWKRANIDIRKVEHAMILAKLDYIVAMSHVKDPNKIKKRDKVDSAWEAFNYMCSPLAHELLLCESSSSNMVTVQWVRHPMRLAWEDPQYKKQRTAIEQNMQLRHVLMFHCESPRKTVVGWPLYNTPTDHDSRCMLVFLCGLKDPGSSLHVLTQSPIFDPRSLFLIRQLIATV
jgi:hypothetical protein